MIQGRSRGSRPLWHAIGGGFVVAALLEVASVVLSGLAYADRAGRTLVGYVMYRLAGDMPVFALGALVGAIVGAAVAQGWGVRRRWVVAAAAALGMGYLAVWASGVIGGLAG